MPVRLQHATSSFMSWNRGACAYFRIPVTKAVARRIAVLSLLGGMIGVTGCAQVIGLSDVPQEMQPGDGSSGSGDATVDAPPPSPDAGLDSSSADATRRDASR
jgi:hypothetical protein